MKILNATAWENPAVCRECGSPVQSIFADHRARTYAYWCQDNHRWVVPMPDWEALARGEPPLPQTGAPPAPSVD